MRIKPAVAAVVLAAALALGACSDADEQPTPEQTAVAPADTAPADAPVEGGEEGFEGSTNDDSIMVGPMEVLVPKGFKLPEDSIVTKSEPSNLMLIDEDPQPVIDAVRASAEEAGYEIYAEAGPDRTVFVGQGNAVLFFAIPNAQMITWGPEAMKDVLAESQ